MHIVPGNYVLVTTLHRGVFAGEVVELDESNFRIVLKNARCAIHWRTTRGFLELASDGPNSGRKIGAIAPQLTLYGVTSISICSEEAKVAWQTHP